MPGNSAQQLSRLWHAWWITASQPSTELMPSSTFCEEWEAAAELGFSAAATAAAAAALPANPSCAALPQLYSPRQAAVRGHAPAQLCVTLGRECEAGVKPRLCGALGAVSARLPNSYSRGPAAHAVVDHSHPHWRHGRCGPGERRWSCKR